MTVKVAAIVAAAGAGLRMKGKEPKQYMLLEGRPVLARSLSLFLGRAAMGPVVLVIPPGGEKTARAVLEGHCSLERVTFVEGGASRQQSVARGLAALDAPTSLVCIHDAARPLASPALLERLLEAARHCGAAVPAIALGDTVKQVDEEGFVLATPDRTGLRLVQTPQVFRRELIEEAYRRAAAEKWEGTDDASLVERLGRPVLTVPGEATNFKLTTPVDLALAALVLRDRGTTRPLNTGEKGPEGVVQGPEGAERG